jgi:mono/diheme cytochrome c family protein
MRFVPQAAFAFLILASFGCSDRGDPVAPDGGDPEPTPSVSYQDDVQPIWITNCASCHGANGGLTLAGAGSRANLVGVVSASYAPAVRVVPDDPAASVLYQKLVGNPEFGDRMPLGGALSSADLTTVRTWIEEGALDN